MLYFVTDIFAGLPLFSPLYLALLAAVYAPERKQLQKLGRSSAFFRLGTADWR
jgi:hypothetical protein